MGGGGSALLATKRGKNLTRQSTAALPPNRRRLGAAVDWRVRFLWGKSNSTINCRPSRFLKTSEFQKIQTGILRIYVLEFQVWGHSPAHREQHRAYASKPSSSIHFEPLVPCKVSQVARHLIQSIIFVCRLQKNWALSVCSSPTSSPFSLQ